MRRGRLVCLVVAAIVAGAGAVVAGSPGAASTFVRDLGDRAIGVLGSADASLAKREAKLRALLRSRFDMRVMGRFALGRYWRRASAEQRRDYLDLFGEYVVSTYSAMLGGYTGEKLTIVSETPLSNKIDVLVNTRITRPSGPPVKATWRVRARDDDFRIIDVMIEGISMVVTQRQQFSSVIQRHGLEGLLETLRARTAKLNASR